MDEQVYLKKLGQNIRRIRKERGISQGELGYQCDIERPSISRIEAGNTNPTTLTLKRISEALGVLIEDLFKFEKGKK